MLHPAKSVCALAVMLAGWVLSSPAVDIQEEVRRWVCEVGDTLIVQADAGTVRIQGWEGSRLEVRSLFSPPGDAPASSGLVTARKEGSTIRLQSGSAPAETRPSLIQVYAPRYLHVTVWGEAPAVEIDGIEGAVRVQTLAGTIRAANLATSASLISDRGTIHYYTDIQPGRDVRLETGSGDIRCELDRRVRVRAWMRAGGTILWDTEEIRQVSSVERESGRGGPLLYASSTSGNVEIRMKGEATGTPASPVTAASSGPPAGTPLPAPAGSVADAGAGVSSDASSAPVDGRYTFKVNVRSVYLNVSVRDRATNRSIPHLGREDFQVYEDGVLQDVAQLESTEAPFNLLLLLDVSGSTRSFIDLVREASIEFTGQIKPSDRIGVAVFNSRVRLIQEFTDDRRAAARAIDRIVSGGGTAFYDALETCLRDYLRGIEGRTAIVVFTDGVDNQLTGDRSNASLTTFEELYRQIQEVETIIYTIFLESETHFPSSRRQQTSIGDIVGDIVRGRIPGPQGPSSRRGGRYEQAREQLRLIADQTGGRMYSPTRIEDLASVYSEIADDLRIQYQLAYNSSNTAQDGSWRSLRVMVRDRPGAVARTRKGYYAEGRR